MVAGIRLRRWVLAGLLLLAGASVASGMTIRPAAVQSGRPALLLQGRIVPGDAAPARAALAGVSPRVAAAGAQQSGRQRAGGAGHGEPIRALRRPRAGARRAVCASACFMLFAAARNKLVEPGAMVGVHSASVAGGNETMDTLGVTTLMARSAASYGVPSAITGRMVTTRPGQMAWLNSRPSSNRWARGWSRVRPARRATGSHPVRPVVRSPTGLGIRARAGRGRGRILHATRGHRRSGGLDARVRDPAGALRPRRWRVPGPCRRAEAPIGPAASIMAAPWAGVPPAPRPRRG